MTWQEIEVYCKGRLQEIEHINHVSHTPSALCCLASFVGYLSRLAYWGALSVPGVTYGQKNKIDTDEDAFNAFIVKCLPLYASYFSTDSQGRKHYWLYTVLRCGIVHSMSFYDKWKPNDTPQPTLPLPFPPVVVSHSAQYSVVGTPLPYAPYGQNAIIINAFDLCREVRNAIALMFADSTMRSNAETFVRYQPPIHDLGNASAVNLAAGSGSISSGTPTAQAIAQTSAPTQSNLLSGG